MQRTCVIYFCLQHRCRFTHDSRGHRALVHSDAEYSGTPCSIDFDSPWRASRRRHLQSNTALVPPGQAAIKDNNAFLRPVCSQLPWCPSASSPTLLNEASLYGAHTISVVLVGLGAGRPRPRA